MRLLVTGGCGFFGSNFMRHVLQHYGPEMVTNVDALTTGQLANAAGIAETYGDRYEFFQADFADGPRMDALMAKHQYFAVIHFAATADVAGTETLLERARQHGVRRFVQVSAGPSRPDFSAVENAVLEACRAFEQETVIVQSDDSFGPCQAPEEFIPSAIICALRDVPVKIHGDGSRARGWLHVDDLGAGIFAALLNGQPGATYGFTAEDPVRDIDLAHSIIEHLGKSRDLIQWIPDASGRPAPPATDGSRARGELEWKPLHRLASSLHETIEWYVHNREWWQPLL